LKSDQPSIYYRRNLPHFQPPNASYFVTFRLSGSLPITAIIRLQQEKEEQEKQLLQNTDENQIKERNREYRELYLRKVDQLLDHNRIGPRWLNQPAVAKIVVDALHFRDGKVYDLLAFCVMPNHIHLVFTIGESIQAESDKQITGSTPARPTDIKRFTLSSSDKVETVNQYSESPEKQHGTSRYLVTDIVGFLKKFTAYHANAVLKRNGAFWQHESYDHVIRDGAELERTIWYVLNNPANAGLVDSWQNWQYSYCKPGLLR